MSTGRLPPVLRGSRFSLEGGGRALRIVRAADGARVGEASVRETDHRTLEITSVCVDQSERGYGAGSEAALLIVDAARAVGYRRIRAAAPRELGLAVYFWMRMGFRPRFGADAGLSGSCFERDLG